MRCLNSKIKSKLESIEISHAFALNYNHGVKINGKWDMFEPTRFVYAFFAFNMIYAIDWETTISQNRFKYYNSIDAKYAKEQIQYLIDFIYQRDERVFEKSLECLDKSRSLYSVVSILDDDYNSSRLNSRNTGNTIAEDFLVAANNFSERNDLSQNEHFDLLQMSYTVRNNLFHGEKKAHDMKEKGHRNRLLHYGNIILATNESFFEIMKNNFNYRRIERWEVEDNI
jgi:hypothetical protein